MRTMLSTRSAGLMLAVESVTKKGTSLAAEMVLPFGDRSSPTRKVCGPGGKSPSTSREAARQLLDNRTVAGWPCSEKAPFALSGSSAARVRRFRRRDAGTISWASTLRSIEGERGMLQLHLSVVRRYGQGSDQR